MSAFAESEAKETFVLNLGPQHPATHGVLRVKLTMDGEYIAEAEPVLGYIHRMHEKMGENRTWAQFLPNTGRMDYLHALAYNHGYVSVVERAAGIEVSLFIDPDMRQIDAALRTGASTVELHTGAYAAHPGPHELQVLRAAIEYIDARLIVNAGHGLHYHNVEAVAALPGLHELNIGHAIIAQALFVGLPAAVSQMRALMDGALRA